MRRMLAGLAGVGALALTPAVAAAQNAVETPFAPATVVQVKPGLYMLVGNGGTSVVRVGKDGVVLVDTKNPSAQIYADLVARIKSVTALPVKEVIVTHHHHPSSGNAYMFQANGVPVVGNKDEVEQLAAYNTTHHAPNPDVVYDDKLTIHAGGVPTEIYHFGPGHTGGDSVVYFPDIKVVTAGDLVPEITAPHADFAGGGSLVGFVKNLDAIAKLDFDYVVPGDGDRPLTKAEFLAYKKKVETLVQRASAAEKSGVTKDKFLAAIKTDDLGWTINDKTWQSPAQLNPLYAEMGK